MEENKASSHKKILTIVSLIIAFSIGFIVATFAWFTDLKVFNNPVNMGVVEIDTSSGEGSQSALTKTIVRNIGDYAEGGKVMPGDTINFNFRIKLSSNSEPSYYLVKIVGTGLLTSLNSDNYYYLNGNEKTIISNSATGDDRTCGIITASDVKNLTFSYSIPLSHDIPNVSGKAFCIIAAIQQSNITIKDAYDILKDKLDPIYYYCDEDGTMNPAGNFIAFGSYPQSLKEDGVTITGEPDANGYYPASDGEKYVNYGANYYKVEPIVWQILKTEGNKMMLITNKILDRLAYQTSSNINGNYLKSGIRSYDGEFSDGTEWMGNYKFSNLRTWLNTTFYDNFTTEEKAIIQTTDVDNSKATANNSNYAPDYEITHDKVFALSCQEYMNTAYFANNSARIKTITDYAGSLLYYWTRSPHPSDISGITGIVMNTGGWEDLTLTGANRGFIAAIVISL